MLTLAISTALLFGSPATEKQRQHAMARRHALQVTNYLKGTDPRVLKQVMQQMGWMTSKQCTSLHTRNRNQQDFRNNERRNKYKRRLDELNQLEIDMLLDRAGVPRQRVPKRKKTNRRHR
jgi:hypothetical protein